MAILIEMTKVSEENDSALYNVMTELAGKHDFYVRLVPSQQLIYFYKDEKTLNPVRIIDLTKNDSTIEVPGISSAVVFRVILQAIKAFRSGVLPDRLNYAA